MSQLLILRHAIALDRTEAAARGIADSERLLSDKGARRMREVAAGIASLVEPPVTILSSPYLRTRQTAQILARNYPDTNIEMLDELAPGCAPRQLIHALNNSNGETLIIVGHEPDLSSLASLLLCRESENFIQLKKAAAALLEFPNGVAAGKGVLQWLMQPGQLRLLAGK